MRVQADACSSESEQHARAACLHVRRGEATRVAGKQNSEKSHVNKPLSLDNPRNNPPRRREDRGKLAAK